MSLDSEKSSRGTSAQSELIDDIETAIAPWKSVAEKPPFSLAELVVMAMVSAGEFEVVTNGEIMSWICAQSQYYQLLAVAFLTETLNSAGARSSDFHEKFWSVFEKHGVPIYCSNGVKYHYTINSAARLYLGNCLSDSAREPGYSVTTRQFPFFRLPAEIRNNIYDMVFYVSPNGVEIVCRGPHRSGRTYRRTRRVGLLKTWSEDPINDTEPRSWWSEPIRLKTLNAGRLKDLLSRTAVCRQWYRESIQAFYAVNTFICWDLEHMHDFLYLVPKSRRSHITKLGFAYTGSHRNITFRERGTRSIPAAAFKLLAQLPKLQILYINDCKEIWGDGRYDLNAEGMEKRPGLRELMTVRISGEVVVHDALDATKRVLTKALVVKSAKQPKGKAATRLKPETGKMKTMPARGKKTKSS